MNTEYLKTLLTKRKQTRYNFCKITGFSSGALTDILNKKVKDPRNSTIVKIATALDLNEHEFAELCGYRNVKKKLKKDGTSSMMRER